MKGTLYCIGVGPGDPELLTLKGLKYITSCPVLAVPQGKQGILTAKQIVIQAVSAIDDVDLDVKEILTIDFPMTRDEAVVHRAHAAGAAVVEARLDQGLDVALITIGCPTVYATSMYIHDMVVNDGYTAEIIPGVPSFCAAAAALHQPLCEKDELLLIIPANRPDRKSLLAMEGNKVLMKPAANLLDAIKKDIAAAGTAEHAAMVERCGLPGERIYPSLEDAAESPYFSVILIKSQEGTT